MIRSSLRASLASLVFFASATAFAQDPTALGPFSTATASYGDDASFDNAWPGCGPETGCQSTTVPSAEIRAEVYYPTDGDPATPAAGRFPLLVFLHGNHAACYKPSTGETQHMWPCDRPGGFEPIPNHRGYDYIGRVLASHGYIVASVSATGINAQGGSLDDIGAGFNTGIADRANLIEAHLSLWNEFDTVGSSVHAGPFASGFLGKVDLRNVGTMGHSRGGDAVVKHFGLFSATSPFLVRAVLPIAPTKFGTSPINNVPLGVLLGHCDGDVRSLIGAQFYDLARYNEFGDQASKHLITTLGGNHNYFNTAWTPDCWEPGSCWSDDRGLMPGAGLPPSVQPATVDDWTLEGEHNPAWGGYQPAEAGDSFCDSTVTGHGRLTPAAQRQVGLTYVAAFFRYYLGNELAFGPLLRGDEAPPAGLANQRDFVGYHPPAFRRKDVNRLSSGAEVSTTNTLGGAVTWTGSVSLAPASCTTCFSGSSLREPHSPVLNRARVAWDSPASSYVQALPLGERDVSRFSVLQFRAGVDYLDADNPTATPLAFSVTLSDGANSATVSTDAQLGENVLYFPPGGNSRANLMHSVRLSLADFAGIDFTNVQEVSFTFDGTPNGTVMLSDIAFTTELEEMPSDVVIVVDRSGSMVAEDFADEGNTDTRLEIANLGAKLFASTLDPVAGHRVALVAYNQGAASLLDGTGSPFVAVDGSFDANSGPFASALGALTPDGATSIGGGVDTALDLLSGLPPDSARRRAILLLTDGRQNTAPCLGVPGLGGVDTGDCAPGGGAGDPITRGDPRLQNVPICSIGMGRAEGQVDEKILEHFSSRYLDATPNAADLATAMADFSKCVPEFSPGGIAVDPSGILERSQVSAPAFDYLSAGDTALTFVSSWSATTEEAGDVRLIVTKPDGGLLLPESSLESSLREDWHVQRDRAPERGNWRFQVTRDTSRFVNGFASNAFAVPSEGVTLARRQIQRLCADGCDHVLSFEDGRVGSGASVYAAALALEQASGLVGTVQSFDASSESAFTQALGAENFDLLVFVHQLDTGPSAVEPYDQALESVLCGTSVPAIVTDTRAGSPQDIVVPTIAKLVLDPDLDIEVPNSLATLLNGWGALPDQIHACSGAYATPQGRNFATLTNSGDTLLDASIALTNPGYEVFSYPVAALPFDAMSEPGIGATQLEGSQNLAYTDTSLGPTLNFGAIVSESADQAFTCATSEAAACDSPRLRDRQRWGSEIQFEGLAPITPVIVPTDIGQGVTLKFKLDRFLPEGGFTDSAAWVRVVYPTVGLDELLSDSTCQGSLAPNGDVIPGTGFVSSEAVPFATMLVNVNDSGLDGDAVAGDRIYSAHVPTLGQVTGTYQFFYFAELSFVDADGVTRTMHRESQATQYVGEEVRAGSQPCGGGGGGSGCDNDLQSPELELAPPASVQTCGGMSEATTLTPPAASDNCGVASVVGRVVSSDNPQFPTPSATFVNAVALPPGTFLVEWRATDAAGNVAFSLQSVTVRSNFAATHALAVRDRSKALTQAGGFALLTNRGSGVTEVFNDAIVGGLLSVGNVRVWHRADVFGDIFTQGTATIEPTAEITGDVVTGASFVLPPGFDLSSVTFPNTAGNQYVNSGQTLTLPAGNHPNVLVNSQGTLVLGLGDHYFRELHVNSSSSVLRVSAPAGTRVFVRDAMDFRSSFTTSSGGVADVFLGFRGSSLSMEANFNGVVLAPDANLMLGTSNAKDFRGGVHARSIELRNDAVFTCVPRVCTGANCTGIPPG